MSYFLRAFWRGEIELQFAFWAVGIAFTLIFIEHIGMAIVGLSNEMLLVRIYTAFIVAVNVFVLPGIWRSAGMYQGPVVWSLLARMICLLAALRIGYTFIYLSQMPLPLP